MKSKGHSNGRSCPRELRFTRSRFIGSAAMWKSQAYKTSTSPRFQPWGALIAYRNWQIFPAVMVNLSTIGFILIARLFGWTEPIAPDWLRFSVFAVAILGFALMFAFSWLRGRNPVHSHFVGRCFSCGEPRTEFLDRCTFCGSDFVLQDWNTQLLNSRRGYPARILALLIRQFTYAVVLAVFNGLIGGAFFLWMQDPPTSLMVPTQNLRLFVLAIVSSMIMANVILIVATRPLRQRLLRGLAGRCLNCGHPVDLCEDSCTKCSQSLLPQRAYCCTNPSLNFLLGREKSRKGDSSSGAE